MRVRTAGLAAVCLLATACGSTVGVSGAGGGSGTGASADGSGQGLGAPGGSPVSSGAQGGAAGTLTGAGGAVPGTTGAGGTNASGSGGFSGSAGSSGSGGSTSGSGGTGSASLSGALVPATFNIGLQWTSNGGAAIGAVTGKNQSNSSGDGRDPYKAVLAWINKHGGIAGRPAVAKFNDINAYDGPSQQSQTACAQWTQDDHVALAVPTNDVGDMNLMRDCLGKANTPGFMGYVHARTLDSSFKSSPLWFENATLSLEGYARTYVGGLAKQGFFKGGKVGVVYYDKPPFTTAFKNAFLPALAAVGVSKPETFAASIDGAETLGSGSKEMDSAVLTFRTNGVTKVLFYEPWIGYFEFLNHAKSQQYHPTYGFSSQQGTQIAADLGFVPADQLTGARLVSWNPMVDGKGYQPYLGPRFKLCQGILHDAGIDATDQTTAWAEALDCEQLLVIQDAYRNAGRHLSPGDFTRGMEALGSGVQVATRNGGSFAPTKHWAIAKWWAGHFDSARGTFVLEGAAQNVL